MWIENSMVETTVGIEVAPEDRCQVTKITTSPPYSPTPAAISISVAAVIDV